MAMLKKIRMKKILLLFIFACLCLYSRMQAQTPCIDPMPANDVSVRLHPSMKLSWKLSEGTATAEEFAVYAGKTEATLVKINVPVNIGEQSTYNITYAPVASFVSDAYHYWRVDVVKGGATITGEVWKFKPVALDADNLIDGGTDYDGVGITYNKAASGFVFSAIPAAPDNNFKVYEGTNRELTFTPVGSPYTSGNGCYLQRVNTPYWEPKPMTDPVNNHYIDMSLTSELSAQRTIKRFIINGTDINPNGTVEGRTSPVILFSDQPVFDENSILDYSKTTLGHCRTVVPSNPNPPRPNRGQAAIIVDAPEGAKSIRVAIDVRLTKTGDTYKIDPAGEITLTAVNVPRIAYLAVELSPLPQPVIDPMPANDVSVRLHPSMKLSWKLAAGETAAAADFKVYAGATAETMTEVNATAAGGASMYTANSFNVTYTPAAPFVSEAYHYWRVDVVKEGITTPGRVWRFKPIAPVTENLIDGGRDYDGVATSYNNAVSTLTSFGAIPAPPDNNIKVYEGTNRELTFTPGGVTSGSGNGGYLQSVSSNYWQFALNDAHYIDMSLTHELSAQRTIKRFMINGTDASPNGGSRTSPVILFSDQPVFDTENILGYTQVTLGICRTGGTNSNTSNRGQAAIIVDVPEGTKSIRIMSTVKLGRNGAMYQIDPAGETLTSGSYPRIAYLAVELDELKGDNTFKNLTVNNKQTVINHSEGTATVTLPALREWSVAYEVNVVEGSIPATADFASGALHNFADGPLTITVTDPSIGPKIYTVTVTPETEAVRYADLGQDWVSGTTVAELVTAKSGVKIKAESGAVPYVVYSGTDNELTVDLKEGATSPAATNGGYLPSGAGSVITYLRINANEQYIEVTPTNASREKRISTMILNGTSASTASAPKPIIIYSGENPFNPENIVGYSQVEMGPARAPKLAVTAQAPAEARTARIYRNVTLAETGVSQYKIDAAGTIALTDGNEFRIAYMGVNLRGGAMSDDASFAMSVSHGTIVPPAEGGTEYRVNTDDRYSDITITARTNNVAAVMVDGDGGMNYEKTLPIVDGDNVFYLAAVAENGNAKAYTVTVYRRVLIDIPISFDANGSTMPADTPDKLIHQEFEIGELPAPFPIEGYTFMGWNTSPDGSGTAISEGTICRFEEPTTLYAFWKINTYTVIFNSNAVGVLNPPSKQIKHNNPIGTLYEVDDRKGLSFGGWNDRPDGSGVQYAENTPVTANVTLYAIWNEITTGTSELAIQDVVVYPNPATDRIYVRGLQNGDLISIFDIAGRLLSRTRAADPLADISVSNLPKGTYLVKITSGNFETVQKVVIVK
jgi:hypothetical protein